MSSTTTQPYNGPLGKGTFTTTITVKDRKDTDYLCSTRLDAIFTLKLDGGGSEKKAKEVEVGYIAAYIIDKTLTEPGVKGALGRLWVQELLRNPEDEGEMATVFRALYTRGGARRPALTPFANQLKGSRVCFLDTLIIERRFRGNGNGIGAMALAGFHALLPNLRGKRAFKGTVLLSPGMPLVTEKDYPGYDINVSEQILQRFYQRSGGYEAFVTMADKHALRTVMGRTV